jgi:hypothetical protein
LRLTPELPNQLWIFWVSAFKLTINSTDAVEAQAQDQQDHGRCPKDLAQRIRIHSPRRPRCVTTQKIKQPEATTKNTAAA